MPRMLDDLFKIVLDPLFQTQKDEKIIFPVDGVDDTEQMWTQIYQI